MSVETSDDAKLARSIASEAGALLLELRDSGIGFGKALGDLGDQRANALILDRLHAARPGDAILSEESADDLGRCAKRRSWIIDPLDGTREYAEGRDDWAVHIGLAIDGQPAVGAVALPALGLVFDSESPPPLAPANRPPRMLVSRTRASGECGTLADRIGAERVPMGSAGAKAMAVLRGIGDLYFHSGGQYQWDNCAPVAVALAAGLHASRIDGSPLLYNCAETSIPDLLICRKELADRALAAIAEHC